MKKILIVILGLLSLSVSATSWKCEIQDVCSPVLSPFTVNVDKSFILFPELGGDHSITNSGREAEVLFFDFDLGRVEIVMDTGIYTPMGGNLTFEGQEFNIHCLIDFKEN